MTDPNSDTSERAPTAPEKSGTSAADSTPDLVEAPQRRPTKATKKKLPAGPSTGTPRDVTSWSDPFGVLSPATLRLYDDLDRAEELTRTLRQVAAGIHTDQVSEGTRALWRDLEVSSLQKRQYLEAMAATVAIRHSALEMLHAVNANEERRRDLERKTAFLTELAFAERLDTLAKQSLAFMFEDAATEARKNVATQLTAEFVQQRDRGFDALGVYDALRVQPSVAARWAASLASLGLPKAREGSDSVVSQLRQVLGEEIATSRALVGERAASSVEGEIEGESDLAMLVTAIWTRVAQHWERMPPELRVAWLALIVTSLLQVGSMMMTWQQAVDGAFDSAAGRHATEKLEGAVRAQTEAVTRQQRFVAKRARPLRVNPEAAAEQIGSIPAGATIILRYRVERWLFVTVVDGPTAGSEGWVFLRDLQPVTR